MHNRACLVEKKKAFVYDMALRRDIYDFFKV